jgi:flavin-binding protein dodecin
MGDVGKIIEYVSTSNKSFDDAIRKAVEKFAKSENDIRGIDIIKMTARIEGKRIKEYRVNVKLSAEA